MKYSICIWMNIPSHHQKTFFDALVADLEIDLKVVYFNRLREARKQEGWQEPVLDNFETILSSNQKIPDDIVEVVPDWQQRIHIFSYCSYPHLAKFLTAHHTLWVHWSDRGGIAVLRALKGSLPLYHLALPIYHAFKKIAGRYISNNAYGVFKTGMLTGKYFQAIGIDAKKMENLYYSCKPITDASTSKEISDFLQNDHCILYVGSINTLKGFRELIQAFHKLHLEHWKLVFCGKDKSSGVAKRMVEQCNIADKVLFIPPVQHSQIGGIYKSADVVVLPSYFDGWGMTLMEAASCGKALISTDQVGAAYEIIQSGVNGFRIKAGSTNDLYGALLEYTKDLTLSKKHGEASKQIFDEKLCVSANVQKVKEALVKWQIHK